MTDWAGLERQYSFSLFKRVPLTLVRGEGTRVFDEDGRAYLDFVAGIASVSLGHSHPVLVQAIQAQAAKLMHVSNLYYSVPQILLAQLLCENSCFDRVFFCNSGTEAVEGAIKLARKWGKVARDGAYEIIVAEDAFHGRTFASLSATAGEKYRAPFTPLLEGFRRVPFNDVPAVRAAIEGNTVAVLLEPIQGEAGVVMPDEDYLPAIRALCDETRILLILDEVQTGMGRTGTLFAHQTYGIEPDIMALAKGLGGGFPIGAFLAREGCSVFAASEHASTFGGNPLACQAAYAVLKYMLDNGLPAEVSAKGDYLCRRLHAVADRHALVVEIRGKGLLLAIGLASAVAERAVHLAMEEGLLVNNVRPDSLRLMPPLTVSNEELDEAVDIIERVIVRLAAELESANEAEEH